MSSISAQGRLAAGSAFADLSDHRVVSVGGADARRWLNDLVSAEIEGLASGEARPSCLLSPTGGVRATFMVTIIDGSLTLLQDPGEPSIPELLDFYVLSSDVRLEDRSGELAIFGFPGFPESSDPVGLADVPYWWSPSVMGAGFDVAAPAADHDRVESILTPRFARASDDEVEAWRVAAAIPKLGVDTSPADLPQEVGLVESVAFDKGCFVGQEAVAKMANLGHPRWSLLPVESSGPIEPGEIVEADGKESGAVTSVANLGGDRFLALARVRWSSKELPLRAARGAELRIRNLDAGMPGATRPEPPTE